MLDCVSHRACEETAGERGTEPHVHAVPVHDAPPGLVSSAHSAAIPGIGGGGGAGVLPPSVSASGSASGPVSGASASFHGPGSASGPALHSRSSGVARGFGVDKSGAAFGGVALNETEQPRHTCGSDVAYAYFVSFIFLCSFLVRRAVPLRPPHRSGSSSVPDYPLVCVRVFCSVLRSASARLALRCHTIVLHSIV